MCWNRQTDSRVKTTKGIYIRRLCFHIDHNMQCSDSQLFFHTLCLLCGCGQKQMSVHIDYWICNLPSKPRNTIIYYYAYINQPTVYLYLLPCSRKLLRENTFANFAVSWYSQKFFSVKIVFFTNSRKFSPSKVPAIRY